MNRSIPKCARATADDEASELIGNDMGAVVMMSTPRDCDSFIGLHDSFVGLFSGKLSSVTPTPEKSVQSEPQAEPKAGAAPPEVGGRTGPDPTRYGDWELRGRCIDF